MQRITFLALIISIALVSCGSPAEDIPPTIDVNALYTQVAQTMIAGIVQTEEASAAITQEAATEQPTQTPIPDTQQYNDIFAWNYLAEQTSGDVTVQISRVIFGNKESLEKYWDDLRSLAPIFQDKAVLGEIIFKITNNSDTIVTLHPNQGTVIVGSEQINLADYLGVSTFGENTGGDFFPGVTVIGGMWFGVKRTPLEEINSMIFASRGPVNSADWNSLGDDYQIQLDLSEHSFSEMPDELK
jgi:hypothetical protein